MVCHVLSMRMSELDTKYSISNPRFYCPAGAAFEYLKITQFTIQDVLFNERNALAERFSRVYFHIMRPRRQNFRKCTLQGHDRTFQGVRSTQETRRQRGRMVRWREGGYAG